MNTGIRLINRLLGILSLEDIENLTTISEGKEKVPLTFLVDEQFISHRSLKPDESMAKILPFEQHTSLNESAVIEGSGKDVLLNQNVQAVKSPIIEKSVDAAEGVGEQGKMGTTVFILSQRKKFEPNHKKLKAKEVMDCYLKNAAVDINEERKLKEDLRQSANSGILINKRQF